MLKQNNQWICIHTVLNRGGINETGALLTYVCAVELAVLLRIQLEKLYSYGGKVDSYI